MKRSISTKIFVVALGFFLFALLAQWLLVSGAFNRLYRNSIYSALKSELRQTIADYRYRKAFDTYQPISDYAQETGSSILVFSEDYVITDRDLLYDMRVISLSVADLGEIYVPIAYLEDVYGPNAPFVATGRRVDIELVQVGRSDVYEPLAIQPADFSFRNQTSIKKYQETLSGSIIESNGIIIEALNLRSARDMNMTRAELIYDAVKDCLLFELDIETYLNALCEDTLESSNFEYSFLYEAQVIDGLKYYFVTAQRVVITGFEQAYINRFFYTVYGVLGLMLIGAALMMSRWLSGPVERLSQAAQRIAALDFSSKVELKSQDELGQLANNINKMSDNLQQTLHRLQESNEELEETSKIAQGNEERMKLLLADLSHEFKTPLGLISGYIEVIQKGINTEQQAEYFQIVEDEIDSLTDLVDETIELSKLQTGYWKVNRGHHHLADVLDPIYLKFQRQLAQNGFEVETDTHPVVIDCDAFRIGQVISNFISNALKYSDARKRLTISTEMLDGRKIKILVCNTGYIDPEKEHWKRYTGTDHVTPTRLPSQGIGLDIARKVLEAHGAEYGVDLVDGMVCFFFTLPIVL